MDKSQWSWCFKKTPYLLQWNLQTITVQQNQNTIIFLRKDFGVGVPLWCWQWGHGAVAGKTVWDDHSCVTNGLNNQVLQPMLRSPYAVKHHYDHTNISLSFHALWSSATQHTDLGIVASLEEDKTPMSSTWPFSTSSVWSLLIKRTFSISLIWPLVQELKGVK